MQIKFSNNFSKFMEAEAPKYKLNEIYFVPNTAYNQIENQGAAYTHICL